MNNNENQPMSNAQTKTALILGATGGFGSELGQCMARRGWHVKAATRQQSSASPTTSDHKAGTIELVYADLDKPETLRTIAASVDVIVHAVNVPYPKWDPIMFQYTRSIIELAKTANTHLLFVGNIYNAGIPTDGVITEHTKDAPIADKGRIRQELEELILNATQNGVRATVMRFGDFFGPNVPTANWFNMCTKDVHKNKMSNAGPMDTPHTWAYLPDAAKATEAVLSIRIADSSLPNHMVLPFSGHVFSFAQLHKVLQSLHSKPIKISSIPWGLFKVLALFMPLMRDLLSMRYLWQHDIRLDGTALEALIGQPLKQTPLQEAVRSIVPALAQTPAKVSVSGPSIHHPR